MGNGLDEEVVSGTRIQKLCFSDIIFFGIIESSPLFHPSGQYSVRKGMSVNVGSTSVASEVG